MSRSQLLALAGFEGVFTKEGIKGPTNSELIAHIKKEKLITPPTQLAPRNYFNVTNQKLLDTIYSINKVIQAGDPEAKDDRLLTELESLEKERKQRGLPAPSDTPTVEPQVTPSPQSTPFTRTIRSYVPIKENQELDIAELAVDGKREVQLKSGTRMEGQTLARGNTLTRALLVTLPNGMVEVRAVRGYKTTAGDKWTVSSGESLNGAVTAFVNKSKEDGNPIVYQETQKDGSTKNVIIKSVTTLKDKMREDKTFESKILAALEAFGFDPTGKNKSGKSISLKEYYDQHKDKPMAWIRTSSELPKDFIWRGPQSEIDKVRVTSESVREKLDDAIANNKYVEVAVSRLKDLEKERLVERMTQAGQSRSDAEASATQVVESSPKYERFFNHMRDFANTILGKTGESVGDTSDLWNPFLIGMVKKHKNTDNYIKTYSEAQDFSDLFFIHDNGKVLGLIPLDQFENLFNEPNSDQFRARILLGEQKFNELKEDTNKLMEAADKAATKFQASILRTIIRNGQEALGVRETSINAPIGKSDNGNIQTLEDVVADPVADTRKGASDGETSVGSLFENDGTLNTSVYSEIADNIANGESKEQAIKNWSKRHTRDPDVQRAIITISLDVTSFEANEITDAVDTAADGLLKKIGGDELLRAKVESTFINQLTQAYDKTTIRNEQNNTATVAAGVSVRGDETPAEVPEGTVPQGVGTAIATGERQETRGTLPTPITLKDAQKRATEKAVRVTRSNFQETIQKVFNLSEEQAAAVATVMDSVAATWAKRTGNSVASWYTNYVGSLYRIPQEVQTQLALGKEPTSTSEDIQQAKAMIQFTKSGKGLITAFESADVTTAFHELFHLTRRSTLTEEQNKVLEDWMATKGLTTKDGRWTVEMEEMSARAFEKYLRSGKAPNSQLADIFKQIAGWFKEIYKSLKNSALNDVGTIAPEVLKVFDEMIVGIPDKSGEMQVQEETVKKTVKKVKENRTPIPQQVVALKERGADVLSRSKASPKDEVKMRSMLDALTPNSLIKNIQAVESALNIYEEQFARQKTTDKVDVLQLAQDLAEKRLEVVRSVAQETLGELGIPVSEDVLDDVMDSVIETMQIDPDKLTADNVKSKVHSIKTLATDSKRLLRAIQRNLPEIPVEALSQILPLVTQKVETITSSQEGIETLFQMGEVANIQDVDGTVDPDRAKTQAYTLAKSVGINVFGRPVKHVIEDRGRVVAAMFSSFVGGQYTFDVVVHPEYQKKGYGTQLAKSAMMDFEERSSIENLNDYMFANAVSEDSAKILTRLGFERTSDESDFYIYRPSDDLAPGGDTVFFQMSDDSQASAKGDVLGVQENLLDANGVVPVDIIPSTPESAQQAHHMSRHAEGSRDLTPQQAADVKAVAFNVEILRFMEAIAGKIKSFSVDHLAQRVGGLYPKKIIAQATKRTPQSADASLNTIEERLSNQTASWLSSFFSELTHRLMRQIDNTEKKIKEKEEEFQKLHEGRAEILNNPELMAQYNFSAKSFIKNLVDSLAIERDLRSATNKVYAVIAELERAKGNNTGLAPDTYLKAFQTLADGNPELVLQAIASLDIDWTAVKLNDALKKIEDYATNQNYITLQQKGGENADSAKAGFALLKKNPELRAFAVAYAQAYALEINALELRMSTEKGRFDTLKAKRDQLIGLTDEQLERKEKELFEEFQKKATKQSQIQKELVWYELRLRRNKKYAETLKQQKKDFEQALEEAQAQLNQYRAQLGTVGVFNAAPGESFISMPAQVGGEPTIVKFNYDGNNADAYEAAFRGNKTWLALNKDNPDVDPVLYATVERTNRILKYSIFKGEAQRYKLNMLELLLASAQKVFRSLGYKEGVRISTEMLQVQRDMKVYENRWKPLAQKWEARERDFREATGFESAERFKDEILIPVYAALEAETGIFTDGAALNRGWKVFQERLAKASPDRPAKTENLRPAFEKFILLTKNMSEELNEIREALGITIEDPRSTVDIFEQFIAEDPEALALLGKEAIAKAKQNSQRLKGLQIGWLTLPRIIRTDTLNHIVDTMFEGGWGKRSFKDNIPTTYWWIKTDPETGEKVSIIREIVDNPDSKVTDVQKLESLKMLFNSKLAAVQGVDMMTNFLNPIVYHNVSLFEGATPIEVQQAWERSRGDVVDFAVTLSYNIQLSDATKLEQVERYLNVFLNQFLAYDNLTKHAHEQRTWTDGEMNDHFMADARTTQNIPQEFVTYVDFDKSSMLRHLFKLVSMKHFGKNFEVINTLYDSLNRKMGNDIEKLKLEGDRKKARELEEMQNHARSEYRKYQEWYTRSESSPNQLTRGYMELVRTAVMGMLAQPKSALNNMMSSFDFIVAMKGVNGYSLPAVKQAWKTYLKSPWWMFLETFGKDVEIPEKEGWAMEVAAGIGRQSVLLNEVTAERGSGSQTVGEGGSVVRNLRKFQRVVTQPFGKIGGGVRKAIAPSLNIFDYSSRVTNFGNAMGMIRAYEELVGDLIRVTEGEDLSTIKFKDLDLKKLGINRDAYIWLENRWYDMSNRTIQDLVTDVKSRRERGEPDLTKEDVYNMSMISMNDISMNADINTRPAEFLVGKGPMWSVLLGWPVAKMSSLSESAQSETGDMHWRLSAKFVANMAMMSGIGIMFTLLTDAYDEIFRGRSPNLRKISSDQTPEQNLLASMERVARIGTFGLAGDMAVSVATYADSGGGQRGFSMDDRIVAFSMMQNILESMSTMVMQRGASWATVGNPLISALGGNGVIQYAEILNNALGDTTGDIPLAGTWLDTQRALARKASTGNVLRAAGRELQIEIKKMGFGSPTPLGKAVRDMQVAAYNNDRAAFMESYREARQAAVDMGSDDPEERVFDAWRGRDPFTVFKSPTEAKNMQTRLLASIDDRNRKEVMETIRLYDYYSSLIKTSSKKSSSSANTTLKKAKALQTFSGMEFPTF
jgi:GNAT superfamily N-acetyltransferase